MSARVLDVDDARRVRLRLRFPQRHALRPQPRRQPTPHACHCDGQHSRDCLRSAYGHRELPPLASRLLLGA